MAYGQQSDVWACPNMVGIPLIYGAIPLGKMMFQTIKFEDTVFSDKPICPLEIKGWYERCHRRYSCSLNPKEKGSWVEATKYQKLGGHQKLLLTYIYIHTVTPQKVTCWEVTTCHMRDSHSVGLARSSHFPSFEGLF